jgi:hypothetical protein
VALAVAVSGSPAANSPDLNVWVHYDYMVTPDHSDAPSAAAIKMVMDAFKAHGVALHIDPQHTAIPAHAVIVPDWQGQWASEPGFDDPACTGPDAVLFSDLKARYFHPSSSHPWHYAVFGEHVLTDNAVDANNCPVATENGDAPPLPNMTGDSQIGWFDAPATFGYSFVVAMGSFLDFGHTPSDTTVAAMFMHELGHNLGLLHGGAHTKGNDALANYKPNYISVMNYDFQFGIPYAAPGSNVPVGYRVDYSDTKLPDLNEASLDENLGVQDTAHPTDITYSCADPFCSTPVPALGPIDWNGNGTTTDTNVQSDLNHDGFAGEVLHGFDDWAWIRSHLVPPVVTGFFPATVLVGQPIEICGDNLYSPATVIFGGGATATGSGNQPGPPPGSGDCGTHGAIDVTVPLGAKSGPISVVTTEAKATSSQSLTITP